MNLIEGISQYHSDLLKIRRDIHAHPELCYEEERTSEIVAQKLIEWGIPVIRGMGITGVVGIVKNGKSECAVGLRADMDALPMQEENNFSHASVHEGKMHACGHDGHTAMLLGAAHYLSQNKNFDGTVYLIFQPAEEGGGGAKRMMDDGLFQKCPMDAVFGLHNFPGMVEGNFGARPGPMMASSNAFSVVVKGKGSHAALPHEAIDPIMIAVQIAQGWQTILTRNKKSVDPAVLSITQIHAGSATNVIPQEATLSGTVRTMTGEVLDLVEARMRAIAQHTAEAFGAEIQFEFERKYPPLINWPEMTALAFDVMQSVVGAGRVQNMEQPLLGSEDFLFLIQDRPGCYVFIGNGHGESREQGHGLGPCNLHNGSYDFNDALLPIGATYWIRLAEEFLRRANQDVR
jgi:amidohydrolase